MKSPSGPAARRLALAGALLCIVIWAVNYPAMKVAFRELEPLAYTGWRFLLATVAFVLLALREKAPLIPPKGSRGLALLLALSGVGVYQWFYSLGVAGTTGFSAALLNTTSPLISLLLVAALGWERLTPLVAAGTAVAYGGVALFVAAAHGAGSGSIRGDLLCLGSAACWSVYSVASSRIHGRMRPATAQAVTFAGGTLLVLAYCLPSMRAQDYTKVGALSWTILGLSVLLPLVVSFQLWTYSIRTLGITATTSLGFLVPVIAGVSSAIWTGERFPLAKLAGALVVLAGLALTRLPWKRRKAPEPEALASPPD